MVNKGTGAGKSFYLPFCIKLVEIEYHINMKNTASKNEKLILGPFLEDYEKLFLDTLSPRDKKVAKKTIQILKELALKKFFKREEQLSPYDIFDFTVVENFAQEKSLNAQKRKLMRRFFRYIYRYEEKYLKLNPCYQKVLNILAEPKLKKVKKKKEIKIEHPQVEYFFHYLQEKNIPQADRIIYDVNRFIEFLAGIKEVNVSDLDLNKIGPQELVQYRQHLITKINCGDYKQSGVSTKISKVRRMLRVLKEKGKIQKNLEVYLKQIKLEEEEKLAYIPKPEVLTTFFQKIVENARYPLRDIAFFSLLSSLGLRAGEALNLKIKDIDFEFDTVRVTRKGMKEQLLPLLPVVKTQLIRYLNSRVDAGDKNAPLFINQHGNPLGYKVARYYFRKYIQLAGIDYQSGLHFFRYFLFSDLAEKDNRLETIANLAGHNDVESLNSYIKRYRRNVHNQVGSVFSAITDKAGVKS